MKAEEVRNLNWVKLKNWDDITQSEYGDYGKRYIGEVDVDSFVENIFREIARKLDIPANVLLPILEEENDPFYRVKKKYYSKYSGLGSSSEEFSELKTLLRIPDISFLDEESITVNTIIEHCLKLSDKDKAKVVNTLSLEIEDNLRVDDQKVIEYFDNLPDIEKFNVMKYLGLFDVKIEFVPK